MWGENFGRPTALVKIPLGFLFFLILKKKFNSIFPDGNL